MVLNDGMKLVYCRDSAHHLP